MNLTRMELSFMASTISIGSESVHGGSSKEELDEDNDL